MTKKLILIIGILLVIPFGRISAQYQPDAISYRNGFWDFYHSEPDSAVEYARKLASNPNYAPFLREALHDDFSFFFIEATKLTMWEKTKKNGFTDKVKFNTDYDALTATIYTTLQKMATDPSEPLKNNTLPMYYWVSLQTDKHDNQKATELVKTFINTELEKDDIFQNMAARYALLMYKEIAQNKRLEALAHELLSATINKLSTLQMNIHVNSASNSELKERAWYRYLFASANYLMAERFVKKNENEKAAEFFEAAAQYSPDLTDRSRKYDYSQDVYLFGNDKLDLYQVGYFQHLETIGADKEKVLSALSEMAIRNPSAFKSHLKTFYVQNFSSRGDFQDFWEEKVNFGLDKVPPIKLKLINGSVYSSSEHAEKWTFIDFWGTWCGPCREEHPDLEKFYLSTLSDFSDKLTILTVACRDTKESVNTYMLNFNYSFPVAMQQNKIDKTFNVQSYPTKILISPQGNYLVIPFGIDWVSFIKHYASL